MKQSFFIKSKNNSEEECYTVTRGDIKFLYKGTEHDIFSGYIKSLEKGGLLEDGRNVVGSVIIIIITIAVNLKQKEFQIFK
ncbi:hypothetical protein HERIO_2194 [Hepatospora eriocheir]|uniref:Uncharacterized protein n=1 Tax=Hepatospora eriocheir TaxID=1081669 RepID=A0A1X0Q7S1_9MICR|nr:hypothetical protein HERIO_2194 [Hepatospora eriocheir]